jgi:radical SAM protein with 4Fe4S-binding SPASM domain
MKGFICYKADKSKWVLTFVADDYPHTQEYYCFEPSIDMMNTSYLLADRIKFRKALASWSLNRRVTHSRQNCHECKYRYTCQTGGIDKL